MCLLFYVTNSDPPPDGYRLVLVNNRDEFWERPTDLASFGGKDKCVVCGRDCTPGREDGTWIGMSKEGRIGVLLNVLGQMVNHRRPRGHMVINFVSNHESIEDYFREISENATEYNGFNLVLLDVGKPVPESRLFSNALGYNGVHIQEMKDKEVHGIGNSLFETPWKKISFGKEKFQKICQDYAKINSKEQLVQSLQEMMSDRTKHLPDPVLKQQCAEVGYNDDITVERSQISVWSPDIKYGTRTTTVILVDRDGNCDFIEKTIVTPVSVDNPQFTTTTFNFKLTKTV